MLPAANPGGNAANREAPLPTMSSIKPGNVAVSGGTAQIKSADELRYLPIAAMPTKPCNAITINTFNSSNNINNNNSIKHINNNATMTTAMKTKLTQINLVQNQLKPNVNANNTAQPRYKLVPSNATSNGNANSSLISILSPKTLINPHNNNTQSQSLLIRSMATVPVQQQPKQQQQQPQQQQQNGIVYKSNNNISSSTKTSPCTTAGAQPNVITLVSKKSATNDPANTIRAPVILSKAAVEKLRLKFGQVQAQANAGALILTKPLQSNNNNSNSAISRPASNIVASNAAVPKVIIPAAATPTTTTATTPIPMTLSTLPPLSTLPAPIPLAMTPSMTTPTPLSTPTLTMHTPVTASTPMTVPMNVPTAVPNAVPLAVPTPLPMAVPLVVPLTVSASKPIPLPMAMPMPTNISTPMPTLMPRPMFVPASMSTEQSMSVSSNNALVNSMATPVPIPTPLTMPTLLPSFKIDLPEIKISPLPAVTQNGANSTQKPPPSLAVIMPTLRKIATTAAAVKADQEATPKLQRSNSLGESAENPKIIRVQNNANERRHSVAIMAKELDVVVEQPMPIETITIDDDDSDEEREREAAQKQKEQEKEPAKEQEQQKQASRKNSTASRNSIQSGSSRGSNSNRSSTSSRSSDVELIMEQESQQPVVQKESMVEEPKQQPEVKQENKVKPQEELKQQIEVKPQEELKPQEESKQREQLKPQEVLKPKPTCNTSTLSIVRAESLPLSKEDFEKSLRCDEALSSSSMSACSSSTQSSEGPECTAIRGYKRSMELNFGMLHWRDQHQPGSLQNSNMRFELNRFNLLQINERCEPRRGPASYFDVALFDRTSRRTSNSSHPLLYLCSRCNCHGPASDFLAPRFCSLACVRRAHKRRQAAAATNARLSKQRRLEESLKQLRANHQKEKERKPKPQKRVFRWSEYLNTKGMGGAAPIHLFMNPFPTGPNCFERGMKLEAIDPENCSLFCVCTIVEVRGYRLKLNFDGYSNMYDFWVNADSIDIFPPGWCERTSRVLQAPKGYCPERFTWYRYLVKTNAKAAPCALFTHLNGPKFALNNGFRVGMHLEAEDLNDTGKICVATIADVLDERVRVHFDGWDDCYDFWVHVNSPYIHPCGWHEGRQQLIVPPDYQNVNFNWSDYIAEAGGSAAPAELFAPRQPLEFQPRMKLEVVDQRNPCLIRPATVVNRKSFRVQLHLDCWPTEYYFWLEDDSPDLHPIGWCEATAHELEVPPGFQQPASTVQCDVMEGCRGYGNAKRFDFNVHAQRDCCPYAPENWRQWRLKTVKPPRVAPEEVRQAEPPKPELTEESLEALEKRLNNIEASSSSSLLKPKSQRKRQSVKSRSSSDSEPPEPKVLKHEEEKPLPLPLPVVEHKPEPMELLPPPAAECDVDPRCLKIAKSIVEEYGPQIKRNYHLWQTNSGFDMDNLKSNPIYWTTWDVYEFVERALKSTTIAKTLFDEEIDGRALLMLGRKDLANFFQLKVGPTVTLFSLIVNLRIAVVTKFETPRSGLFGDPESFDSPTVNGHHEEAESTTGESMSTSSSGSEQMEEEESQEEEEEEEVEEKVEGEEEEDDEEAEVEDEEDENVEAEEAEENEEDEEAEEDEEEEDEEEKEDDEAEEQTVVIAVNDDESDKQENAESSKEEDELEEDEDEDEVEDEEEDEDEEANEEENEDEEADEDDEGDDDEEADDDEEEDENEEGEVEKDNVANEDQEESEECAVETGEQSKEEQEEEIDADEELQEQETSSELEEPKKEDCADEFLMGEEDEEQESDTEDDEEESNEHDAKNNADENESDYDAAEESEDLSDDNVDAAADEYDDDGDDYDDKVLEQDLNQSALTQYPKQEPSDEEDVVLDSDDFLSVKPSIVNPEDRDTDVVPTSPHHELLPPVDDLVEDIS